MKSRSRRLFIYNIERKRERKAYLRRINKKGDKKEKTDKQKQLEIEKKSMFPLQSIKRRWEQKDQIWKRNWNFRS